MRSTPSPEYEAMMADMEQIFGHGPLPMPEFQPLTPREEAIRIQGETAGSIAVALYLIEWTKDPEVVAELDPGTLEIARKLGEVTLEGLTERQRRGR